LKLFSQNKVL